MKNCTIPTSTAATFDDVMNLIDTDGNITDIDITIDVDALEREIEDDIANALEWDNDDTADGTIGNDDSDDDDDYFTTESSVPDTMYVQTMAKAPSDIRRMSDVKNMSVQRLFGSHDFVYDITDAAPKKAFQSLSMKMQPYIALIGDDFEFDITAIPARHTITRQVTRGVLAEIGEKKVSGEELEAKVIRALTEAYGKYNAAIMLEKLLLTGKTTQGLRFGNKQFDTIDALDHIAIATIIEHYHTVIRIMPDVAKTKNSNSDILAVYVDDPNDDNYGIYRTDNWVDDYAHRYSSSTLTTKEAELLTKRLFSDAPRHHKETDRDLVVFNNCIFNYATKQTVPFNKKYIFDTKNAVNWRDNPVEPVIYNEEDGTYWRPSEFIPTFFTNDNTGEVDKERVLTVYQSIGAALRPRVSWNMFVTFFATSGNNGKGATLALIRTMLGSDCHTSIPIDEFDDPFSLESLIGTSAVLVDENDGGQLYRKIAKLKAVITGDTIRINRKNKTYIDYTPHVFMIQCFNEIPRFKENTDALWRRVVYVPFTKSFTGRERKYIKDDYLRRPEVLEWFAWYVLTQLDDYYSINEPSAGKAMKDESKFANDLLLQFIEEVLEKITVDEGKLPCDYVYNMYSAWLATSSNKTNPGHRKTFLQKLYEKLDNMDNPPFIMPRGKDHRRKPTSLSVKHELFVYDLDTCIDTSLLDKKWLGTYSFVDDHGRRVHLKPFNSSPWQGKTVRCLVVPDPPTPSPAHPTSTPSPMTDEPSGDQGEPSSERNPWDDYESRINQ